MALSSLSWQFAFQPRKAWLHTEAMAQSREPQTEMLR